MKTSTAELFKDLQPVLGNIGYGIYLLRKNTLTTIAVITVLLLILIAILAPFLAPYPEHGRDAVNPAEKLKPPGGKYLMGTDELGRDIFSRIIFGTRISLQIGVLAVGLSLLIGVPLGVIAGYSGGLIDDIIMRITDIFLSFPPLLLAMAISAFLGPSLTNAMIAIAIAWWPWYTRILRSQAISIRERPFVDAAKAIGTPNAKIIFTHILPNCVSPLIVQASMDFGSVILTSAALSFLGLGAQPPTPEWGLMLNTSRNYFLTAWWYSIFPGIAIFITVLAFNLLGDGLREIFDPKTRRL
ncbi:putative D,D-dipeptide transport system permease protein DdpC [Koleobacter methoxysyntrophicus]|uniref:Putative D,D-dipeptide transport system permease protein DdpC n=1 Tax=Koleobacter methoxysyntrophicus TaxID=2751313 RepID=A0A8A0RN21_9FIRM|nr:nickel transporter permease [Koleobacter methoxysyntrophicus]QSQ08606.1 putative D,D-dipeptide transport system permease protein DdpC [Koleobacter methoxysyntrophicus]